MAIAKHTIVVVDPGASVDFLDRTILGQKLAVAYTASAGATYAITFTDGLPQELQRVREPEFRQLRWSSVRDRQDVHRLHHHHSWHADRRRHGHPCGGSMTAMTELKAINLTANATAVGAQKATSLTSLVLQAEREISELQVILKQIIAMHPTGGSDAANLTALNTILAELA